MVTQLDLPPRPDIFRESPVKKVGFSFSFLIVKPVFNQLMKNGHSGNLGFFQITRWNIRSAQDAPSSHEHFQVILNEKCILVTEEISPCFEEHFLI